jgi:hypothetical protein
MAAAAAVGTAVSMKKKRLLEVDAVALMLANGQA